jgi:hypothetical protein
VAKHNLNPKFSAFLVTLFLKKYVQNIPEPVMADVAACPLICSKKKA